MFKSIFTKYMTTFMLIIIASFMMLASVISTMMVNYYSDASRDRLTSTAEAVRTLVQKRMDYTAS